MTQIKNIEIEEITIEEKDDSNPYFVLKNQTSKYGKKPSERTIDELLNFGVIIIDKHSGPTSHEVSSFVQKILKINKCGHSGTLDPKVSGVLPTGLNRATKLMSYLLKSGKEYIGIMHLHDLVEKEKIIKNINSFIGKIKQLPPVKSAVKRQIREREIYEFEILEIKEKDILFKASVEAGTYIRKLCHDFGEKLGVGAHMTHLRRTRVAHFYEKDSINLLTLKDLFYLYQNENNHEIRKHILPGEDIINNFKKVYVIDQAIKHVKNGLCVVIPAISKLHQDIKKNDTVAIMTLNEELLAMGEAMMDFEEIVSLKKGKAIKAKTVI